MKPRPGMSKKPKCLWKPRPLFGMLSGFFGNWDVGRLVGKGPTVKHQPHQGTGPCENQAGHPTPGPSGDAQESTT